MLSTFGKRQSRKSEKNVPENPATDSAFLRLSHILKEIAESTVNGNAEAVGIKSNTRTPKVRGSKKYRKEVQRCHR